MEKRYKEMLPCGMLHSNGKEYFLLRPSPEKQIMEWEKWNTFRWRVVPSNPIDEQKINSEPVWVYSYPRDLVTTNFSVEYLATMKKIWVWDICELEFMDMEE